MPNQKARYKVKNWSEYNNALVNRYNITLWLNEEVIKKWRHKGPFTKGAQKQYSDLAIEIMLTFRSLLSLPLRATEGFMKSLAKQFSANISIADYSTLSRRQSSVKIKLPKRHISKEPLDIIIDSSGIKVYGEGEWKVRMHGITKRRTWRKLHIAVDPGTGFIVAETLTANSIADCDGAVDLMSTLKNSQVDTLFADGALDRFKVYEACYNNNILPVIKPSKKACIRNGEIWRHRNNNVFCVRNYGLDYWKKVSDYTLRSLAETTFFRYKQTFSGGFQSHKFENQKTEAAIKCKILNVFLDIGRPLSYKVAA